MLRFCVIMLGYRIRSLLGFEFLGFNTMRSLLGFGIRGEFVRILDKKRW